MQLTQYVSSHNEVFNNITEAHVNVL